jgi:predicted dehydrogenase
LNKILIIGCGSIGAAYDMENDLVLTHAKAFYLSGQFAMFFYDINLTVSKKVAEKYNGVLIEDIHSVILAEFDIVSICTPTDSHFHYLTSCLRAKVPVIICEKPISMNSEQLLLLELLYNKSNSKVIVNYFRRFLTQIQEVKELYKQLVTDRGEEITNVVIKYKKGFLNNCSHAFDLIEFITDQKILLSHFSVLQKKVDHFYNDPTIVAHGLLNKATFIINGIYNTSLAIFEIEITTNSLVIEINRAGDSIVFYRQSNGQYIKSQVVVQYFDNVLTNNMLAVQNKACQMLNGAKTSDNFLSALHLNRYMLKLLNH